ncbi:MAG: hypothetical protein DRJ69_00185 [Thermoprotei archaeon]|nr:MAG: hypothetical protein DRJ69_00185 [Thermoprotei archaeon]
MILFEVYSYDGRRVRLTRTQWLHIAVFHPEVAGEEDKIKRAVKDPDVVLAGATEDTRVYYRFYRDTPVSPKYLAVVVKILDEEGFIITSYFTERVRRGRIIWRGTSL